MIKASTAALWVWKLMTPPEPPKSDETRPDSPKAEVKSAWAVPVMWMVIVLIMVSGAVYVFKSCRDLPVQTIEQTGKLVKDLGQQLEKVAEAFNRGTITTTFTSYATTISGSQYLQFATLTQQETFTRKDESSTGFGYIPLPDVIVEASAPVTYTYYLDLNARWDFRLQDGVIYVTAPDIKFNKPAVDASRIVFEIKKDSMIRNTTVAMENLKKSITFLSYKKAEANTGLVREKGRKETEAFVHNWLAKNFTDGKSYPVKVVFRDETKGQNNGLPAKGE